MPISASRTFALALLLASPALAPALAQNEPPELAAIREALRTSHDPVLEIQAVDALGQLGAPDSRSTARAASRAQGPALLLSVIGDTAQDWSVRGEAINTLRTIDAPDAAVKQALAAARADTGDHAGYLQARAIGLQTWSDTRANRQSTPTGDDADAKRRATLLLRQHGLHVDNDALTDTVAKGEPDLADALLTAGLPVGGAAAPRANVAVISGLATACAEGKPVPAGVTKTLALLIERGLPVNLSDAQGNTMLMSAAQFCPAPVSAQLLASGATVDPVNRQQFTPLQMAFVGGKWDVAAVLVDHGARITRQQSSQVFFEPPQDPAVRDLLARATR